ncbi:MAG: serine hydrolase domain-containing protein [Parvibaculaceae bacterium]
MTEDELPISGFCEPRFAPVRRAFIDNFLKHAEPGAAVTVMQHGGIVADLWGGWRDQAREMPWAENTLVNFFSVGKPLAALVLLRLVSRGLASLDDPVAFHWPEFSAHGKDKITLRHILSHQAGLPAVDMSLPADAMLDWAQMIAALEAQAPWWEPGSAHGYHVNTFGFLAGEVVRRLTGKSLGRCFHDEIAAPLGLDIFFGVPASEHARIADFLWPENTMPGKLPDGLTQSQAMRWYTYWNPAGASGAGFVNSPRWRAAEIPSTNGHGTARSVAKLYAGLAAGGTIDGIEIISRDMLDEATHEHSAGPDLVLERDTRFGLAFQLPRPERPFGPNAGAFGHFGAGGSLGFCDPETGIAFAYVTNDMGPRWQNPRNAALMDAVYISLNIA